MPDEIVPGMGTPTPSAAPPPISPPAAAAGISARDAAEIVRMAANNSLSDRVPEWLERGLSPSDVALEIQRAQFKPPAAPHPPAEDLVLPKKDRGRYSYRRAIELAMKVREGRPIDGLEAEVHQELSRNMPAVVERHAGSICIPLRLRTADESLATRTMGTTAPTGGATTVVPQVMDMLEMLTNKALVAQFGATIFSGLTAPVYWPKETGLPSVYWMDENPSSGVTETESALGYTGMTPKMLQGKVKIPRQLIAISSIDVENFVQRRLALAHGLAIDRAFLHGTGTDKQPAGLYSLAGVQSHAVGGVPDRADIVTMLGMAADKNADFGRQAWMTTPLLAAKLKQVAMAANYPLFLWSGTFQKGEMEGYLAAATNQMSKTLGSGANEHGLVFGNWEEGVIGLWGNALEVQSDPYSAGDYGQVIVRTFGMADVTAMHPEAFVVGTGATLS